MAAKKLHSAWWREDDTSLPGEVAKRVEFLGQQNMVLREDTIFHLNVFSNFNVDGQGASDGSFYFQLADKRIRRNLILAGIDTGASMIASGRTMPVYLTANGDFSLSRKAEQRSRVLHSQFYDLGVFRLGVDAYYDGAICGTGITFGYVDPCTGRPKLVRALPNSVYVDAAEGRAPRSIYWVEFYSREQLQATWPKHDADLEDSKGPDSTDFDTFFMRQDNRADLVKVYHAWHLPSMEGATDGKYVMCTSNVVLMKSQYDRQRFPCAVYRYATRRAGFWGQGMAERMMPSQLRLCELQKVVDKCQDNASMAKWLIEENSNVRAEDISNSPGDEALYYQQTPPQLVVWEGTPPDLKQELMDIATQAFEQEGLAPGMIGGELVQKGLNSARAVRAADDVSSRRLLIPIEEMQEYYLQCARLIEDLNDECAANDPDYQVTSRTRVGRRNFLSSSKWLDLALPEGDCRINMFPMAATPTTYQGKIAAVEEWIQGGFVSKPQALDLMEFPDTEAFASSAAGAFGSTAG